MALYQPYLSFPLPNSVRHDRAYTLLSSRVSSTDTLKQIWSNFVSPWFGIPLEKDDANVPSATCKLHYYTNLTNAFTMYILLNLTALRSLTCRR